MKREPLVPLDNRKQFILKAIVNDYVRTAEPVGSQAIAGRYSLGVRSATIRNEMAELAEIGYLRQPHTSAGRIPSDMGYRFYVDRLMDGEGLPLTEAASARQRLMPRRAEVELIIEQTCRVLADLAHYTSLATQPNLKEAIIKHVSIANVAPGRVLAVVVLDNGSVVHELIDIGMHKPTDAVAATNYLTSRLSGRNASALGTGVLSDTESPLEMRDLLAKVQEFVSRDINSADETDVHLEGTSYIMQQPEFKNLERLEAVLSVLDQRGPLWRLFSSIMAQGVTVVIGGENPLGEMCDCSFVGAKYRIGGRVAGTIGVMGPTRMDYRRAVAAVQLMVSNLEELLNILSVS